MNQATAAELKELISKRLEELRARTVSLHGIALLESLLERSPLSEENKGVRMRDRFWVDAVQV